MKKAIYIVCISLGVLTTSACRSTADRCGLAHQKEIKKTQKNVHKPIVVRKATVK